MPRNRFVNPGTGTTYLWPSGHSEEEPTGKLRSITRTANTGLVGAVRQQGEDGAVVLKYTGTINTRAQVQQFWVWYNLCRNQTIFFYDYDDQGYEVQITELQIRRKRKLSYSGRDPSIPHHYYEYNITMEVFTVLQGDMMGVAP